MIFAEIEKHSSKLLIPYQKQVCSFYLVNKITFYKHRMVKDLCDSFSFLAR